MPRRTKGPRLYLRAARPAKRQEAGWVIRDGSKEISTGCSPERVGEAEQALRAYLETKWSPTVAAGPDGVSDPADVLVADVLTLYATEKGPRAPDPSALKARLAALLEFWGEDTLNDIRRSRCQDYVAHRIKQPIKTAKDPKKARRVTDQGARRELEDLSAAIGYWHDEHPLSRRPKVVLPPKAESTRDALSRHQAARLLRAAMGWRLDKGTGRWKRLQGSSRANRQHLRRFCLIGLYTGTRPGVITKLLWEASPTQAWVDLDAGIIYRRGKQERDHKTKRRPLVKIPARLLAHMRRWREQDRLATEIARQAHVLSGGLPSDAPQLSSVIHHGGRPIAGKVRTGFEGIVRDAGLDPKVTPHWMRHTCATWLMEADVPTWEAAGFAGMTTKTLEDCYGHHRPSHQARARKALR
jgi:integrase